MSFIKESRKAYEQVKLVKLKEQSNDHEVSMARGELESIADKALKLSSLLKSKSEAGNPIEAWVQSKITKAADMVNTVHDYMVYNPNVNEAVDEAASFAGIGKSYSSDSEKKLKDAQGANYLKIPSASLKPNEYTGSLQGRMSAAQIQNIKKVWANKSEKDVTPSIKAMIAKMDIPTKHAIKTANINVLSKLVNEELEEELLNEKPNVNEVVDKENLQYLIKSLEKRLPTADAEKKKDLEKRIEHLKKQMNEELLNEKPSRKQSVMFKKADGSTVHKYVSGYDDDEIEKNIKDIMSKEKLTVLKKEPPESVKEEVELDEVKISDIHKMQQDGKSTDEIAKELKLNSALVKRILGEDREWSAQSNAKLVLESMSDAQIALLKKEFDPLKNRQISTARANQLSNILDKLDDGSLQKLRDALIPFVSAVSAAKLTTRKFRGVKITNVKVPGLENMAEDTFKNNITKKIVKPISDYLAKKEKEKEKQPIKEITDKQLDKFHTSLDKLVHKTLGPSSDEKKKEKKSVKEVKEPTGELKDACWAGYTAVGFKMKNGKRVPNCVPKSEAYKGAKSIVEKAWKKLKEKK